MGFLKFLKKKKEGEGVSGLDLPPAPPAFEDISDDHLDSDIPSFEDDDLFSDSTQKQFSAPKPVPVLKPAQAPKPFPSPKLPSEETEGYNFDTDIDLDAIPELPAPPAFEKKSEERVIESPFKSLKPTFSQKNTNQKDEYKQGDYSIPKSTDFSQTSFQISSSPHTSVSRGRSIYVPMNQFKDVLRGINSIRLIINGIEHTFRKMEEIENTKEKSFNSLNLIMHDLQKRLVYVDKKLVNGGD